MKNIIFILLNLNIFNIIYAQVGINTDDANITLEVKKTTIDNFSEGIIIPQLSREELTSKDNMYNTTHKSTLIYVNAINGTTSDKTSLVTKIGYYIFNGYRWKFAEEKLKYFILPAFKLEIDPNSNITTGLTFDIYNEVYKKQLVKQGSGDFITNNTSLESTLNKIYQPNDFDYVITYFDTKILENINISPNGIMTYDIKSFEVNINSFINLLLVIKD